MNPIQAQLLLNAGLAWKIEGALGVACVQHISDGTVMLGPTQHTDAHGNTVPSRDDVKPGARGTREFVVKHRGEAHAQMLELLPTDPDTSILSIALY